MTIEQLTRRVEALQKRMNDERASGVPAGEGLQIILITGCLPTVDGLPLYANAGGHEWLRGASEDIGAFADRVAYGAREAGERLCVIGGFPRSQAQQDMAQAAHAEWLASDDGVPPVTPSPGAPSPVQRAIDDRLH
jgi:hypothetical protein